MASIGTIFLLALVVIVLSLSSRSVPNSNILPLFHMNLPYKPIDRICYSGAILCLAISVFSGIFNVWFPGFSEFTTKVSTTALFLLFFFAMILFLNKAIRKLGSETRNK